jgi:hypothetical protein
VKSSWCGQGMSANRLSRGGGDRRGNHLKDLILYCVDRVGRTASGGVPGAYGDQGHGPPAQVQPAGGQAVCFDTRLRWQPGQMGRHMRRYQGRLRQGAPPPLPPRDTTQTARTGQPHYATGATSSTRGLGSICPMSFPAIVSGGLKNTCVGVWGELKEGRSINRPKDRRRSCRGPWRHGAARPRLHP